MKSFDAPASAPEREGDQLDEAVAAIRAVHPEPIQTGVILGTGLGGLARGLDGGVEIAYPDIPHMPLPTVETHEGRLVLRRLEGRPVAMLHGRFHLYEGYTAREIAFPVRLLRRLGAEEILISFACGTMHPLWNAGDLVMLDDHINLQGTSPLVGPNDGALGPRFPDMSRPYDPELQRQAMAAAAERRITLRRGVYAGVIGPQLETRAEYRMLRALGADVVGMSTVPEVIAARHVDMRVLAIGVVTDVCLPDALAPVDPPEIIRIAGEAEPRLTELFTAVISGLEADSTRPGPREALQAPPQR